MTAPLDKFWVTYKVINPNGAVVSARTGFLDHGNVEKVAAELIAIDHVREVVIERISFVRKVKK